MKALEWENYCYFYLLLKQLAQLFIYFVLSIVHSSWIQFEHTFSDSAIPIEQKQYKSLCVTIYSLEYMTANLDRMN